MAAISQHTETFLKIVWSEQHNRWMAKLIVFTADGDPRFTYHRTRFIGFGQTEACAIAQATDRMQRNDFSDAP